MTGLCGMRNVAGIRPLSSCGGSGCGWRPPGGSPAATGSMRSRRICGLCRGQCGGGTGPGGMAGQRRCGPKGRCRGRNSARSSGSGWSGNSCFGYGASPHKPKASPGFSKPSPRATLSAVRCTAWRRGACLAGYSAGGMPLPMSPAVSRGVTSTDRSDFSIAMPRIPPITSLALSRKLSCPAGPSAISSRPSAVTAR
jgi:hypothetical protein